MSNRAEALEASELLTLEVERHYYDAHFDIFQDKGVKLKSIRISNEDFSEDETHKILLSAYYKHRKNLRDYEYNKRHNYKK